MSRRQYTPMAGRCVTFENGFWKWNGKNKKKKTVQPHDSSTRTHNEYDHSILYSIILWLASAGRVGIGNNKWVQIEFIHVRHEPIRITRFPSRIMRVSATIDLSGRRRFISFVFYRHHHFVGDPSNIRHRPDRLSHTPINSRTCRIGQRHCRDFTLGGGGLIICQMVEA